MKDLSSLEEVDQKLSSMGVQHNRSSGMLNSAEVPDELLKSIEAKKPDDVFLLDRAKTVCSFKSKVRKPTPWRAMLQ